MTRTIADVEVARLESELAVARAHVAVRAAIAASNALDEVGVLSPLNPSRKAGERSFRPSRPIEGQSPDM